MSLLRSSAQSAPQSALSQRPRRNIPEYVPVVKGAPFVLNDRQRKLLAEKRKKKPKKPPLRITPGVARVAGLDDFYRNTNRYGQIPLKKRTAKDKDMIALIKTKRLNKKKSGVQKLLERMRSCIPERREEDPRIVVEVTPGDYYPNQRKMHTMLNEGGVLKFMNKADRDTRKFMYQKGFLKVIRYWLLWGPMLWQSDNFNTELVTNKLRKLRDGSLYKKYDYELCRLLLSGFLGLTNTDLSYFFGVGPRYTLRRDKNTNRVVVAPGSVGNYFVSNEVYPSSNREPVSMDRYLKIGGIPIVFLDNEYNTASMQKAEKKWLLDPKKEFGLEPSKVVAKEEEDVVTYSYRPSSVDIWNNYGGRELYDMLFDKTGRSVASHIQKPSLARFGLFKLSETFQAYERFEGDYYAREDARARMKKGDVAPLQFLMNELRKKWQPAQDYNEELKKEKNKRHVR